MLDTTRAIAIIGAGFGGLSAATYLKRAGFSNVVMFEKESDLGGVWRDNTYPGAACDVPSHLYSFSFEPTYSWTRRYPQQAEILRYLRRCAEKHDLLRHIRFGCEVRAARFDERRGRWTLELAGGAEHEADVLVAAVGQLHRPFVPAIEGSASFAGPSFHSARWDHQCELANKRVAVVGNGASAAQFVPAIVDRAARVHVFQRSAQWIWPKYDRAYSRRERLLMRMLPQLQQLDRVRVFSTFDGLNLAGQPNMPSYATARRIYEGIARRHLEEQVPDPLLRKKLTPNYPFGCKRVLLTNDWLPTLSRPDVEVVTEPVQRIAPSGVQTNDGALREVDVLIWGTGFLTTQFLAPMDVTGLGGRSLRAEWEGGASAYLGMAVTGFPNFFVLYGPNTNLGAGSIVYILEHQARYVTRCVLRLARCGLRSLEVLPGAQRAYNEEIRRRSAETAFEGGCDSWYTVGGLNTNNWVGTMSEYGLRTRRPNWLHFRHLT